MDFAVRFAKGMGSLFYLVNPYETMFEKVEDLPHPGWTASVRANQKVFLSKYEYWNNQLRYVHSSYLLF